MKKNYVYEIYNLMGTVEYVGETTNPKNRFYRHTKCKPVKGTGCGKFYNRQDITMYVVAEFTNRKEARLLEGQLKLEHGLEWTERTHCVDNGKSTRRFTIQQAKEIRALYRSGNYSQYSLARFYNTTQGCIYKIVNNLSYVE